mmetsp:Transcript_83970/g.166725  ORF Transcript_83970/g.166725 Transcript_83970/m.166725 type:complete len:89 (-) Transcript_83970:246-512(-)
MLTTPYCQHNALLCGWALPFSTAEGLPSLIQVTLNYRSATYHLLMVRCLLDPVGKIANFLMPSTPYCLSKTRRIGQFHGCTSQHSFAG